MIYPKTGGAFSATMRLVAVGFLAAGVCLAVPASASTQKPSKPASAPAPKPAAKAPSTTSHPTNGAAAGTHGANTTTHPGGSSTSGPHTVGTTRNPNGTTTTHTARGAEITKRPDGHVASYKGPNGHEAKFDSRGRVREVHGNGMTVSRGPRGFRRTAYDRPDHSRFVAEGHGRGYIQRPYSYRGHTYYSRAYYYHGGYYRAYYHPYYYHGVYLHGYMPSYYYPAAYYGWAYNPWPAPAPYAWGWGAAPWYGYYGAYFRPYPVYPSAAYWLTDYMVAASLQEAYAAGVSAGQSSAELRDMRPRLIFTSYDPATDTTSPVMTKE